MEALALRSPADSVPAAEPLSDVARAAAGDVRTHAEHLLAVAQRPSAPAPVRRAAEERLTERELEVLRLVAQGLNNREIARQLFISENTVKNHVRNILEKLQLHSRMEAVMYAVREKLLDIP